MADEQHPSQALGLTFDFWGVKARVLSTHKFDLAHLAHYFRDFMIKPCAPDIDVFLKTSDPEKSFIETMSDADTEKKILFRRGEHQWQVWETFTAESQKPALVPPFYLPPLLDRVVLLHGAMLATKDGTGIAIFGAPKSGKSLISIALCQKGFSFLTDDQLVYDFTKGLALAYRRPIGIRENNWKLLGLKKEALESATRLDTIGGPIAMVRAEDLGLDVSLSEAKPAFTFFLKNENVKEMSVKDLSTKETSQKLLANTIAIPEQHVPHIETLAKNMAAKEISYHLDRDWQGVADLIFKQAS